MSPKGLFSRRRETSTDYRRPFRPRAIRLANAVLGALLRRGALRISLDEASLIEAAENRTGLLDLGEPSFRQPMRVLLRAIEQEARLHPIGRLIVRARLIGTLETRMRLEEWIRREPAIAREQLCRPIVIVGLPRTGTTLLQRLLASDRRIRALASWEAISPVPLDGEDAHDRRIARAEHSKRALRYLAPDVFAVHPIDARAPEEDVLLLDLAFRSTAAENMLRVPSYALWLEEQDQTPAYRTMHRALQVLQWQRRPEQEHGRWVLKTPHHLEWLDTLIATFPDALVVWTHRDPLEVVPSFCSMVALWRGIFSDEVDPHEIGRTWLRKGARMLARAMEARARLGEGRFIDVRHREIIERPLAVVRTIEERAGMPWTKEAETHVRDTFRRKVQHRHGVHPYALADFGLQERDVQRAFAHYTDAFRPSLA